MTEPYGEEMPPPHAVGKRLTEPYGEEMPPPHAVGKRPTASSMFIIEDDDHFRETFIDVMSLRGIEVTGARTGGEAIVALKQSRPSIIIMDVQLPDVHGFDLCRKVKRLENQKDTPIIFVSASTRYADPRDRVEGLLAGADQFLPKPITVEKLWSEIELVLGKQH